MPFNYNIRPTEIYFTSTWWYNLAHRFEEYHSYYQTYAMWMMKYNFSNEDLFGYSLSDAPYIEYKFIKLNKN